MARAFFVLTNHCYKPLLQTIAVAPPPPSPLPHRRSKAIFLWLLVIKPTSPYVKYVCAMWALITAGLGLMSGVSAMQFYLGGQLSERTAQVMVVLMFNFSIDCLLSAILWHAACSCAVSRRRALRRLFSCVRIMLMSYAVNILLKYICWLVFVSPVRLWM